MRTFLFAVGMAIVCAATTSAEVPTATQFKSPSGHIEVVFEPANGLVARIYRVPLPEPSGLKAQYLLLFYVKGSSDPVNVDWYMDADPPIPAAQLFATFLWSPQEDFVVVTYGQSSKKPELRRQWLMSMSAQSNSRFEGGHLHWVDRYRLVAEVNTAKAPGTIQMIDARREKVEMVVPALPGIGYSIASASGTHITAKEFLNHWQLEADKTSWDYFEPACFDLDLDTMKKRSVPCPKP
jgi:hypothetical protein